MPRLSSARPETRDDEVISPFEAAALLGVSERTLRRWRVTDTGPRFIRLPSGHCRYLRTEVVKYLAEQARGGRR